MNILLVDDDHDCRSCVAEFLKEEGHMVVESANGSEALAIFRNGEFNLILTDIRMPKMSGIELLRKIRGATDGQSVDVVLFTGNGDMHSAVEALRAGAYDYLLKPINVEELVTVIERAGERQALKRENYILTKKFEDAVQAATEETREELTRLKKAYSKSIGLGNVGIFSGAMKQVLQQAKKLHADRSMPVLIEGETGTGKEVVARYIHYGDANVTTPFVDINCAAITPNLFESELFGYEAGSFTGGTPKGQKGKLDLAHGGTLFLDEVTEMPTDLQAKLLRVLQEKEFYRVGGLKKVKTDLRIVCATNVDIEKKVEQGSFRRDFYYRLNVGRIYLPPLRERTEDILPLARMFLDHFSREKGKCFKEISKEAVDLLLSYKWPGNVRELKNTMEWVVLMWDGAVVKTAHLGILKNEKTPDTPREISGTGTIDPENFCLPAGGLRLNEYTSKVILKALKMNNGNKTETARYLGMSRRSLYCRLKNLKNK